MGATTTFYRVANPTRELRSRREIANGTEEARPPAEHELRDQISAKSLDEEASECIMAFQPLVRRQRHGSSKVADRRPERNC
jgi:hypothetical protein